MSEPVRLSGGVLHDGGTYYLLLPQGESDEDEAIIAAGRARDGRIVLTPVTQPTEIVSLVTLPADWTGVGEAAALTADGEVHFVMPDAVRTEIVTGAGYNRRDALKLGRMIALRESEGSLFALGFGGQVYRRRIDSAWEALGPVPSGGGGKPAFNSVTRGPRPGSHVFCGVNVGEYAPTEAIAAADSAGDASLLADLIFNALGEDTPSLRLYDAAWTAELFEGDGILGPVFSLTASSWYLIVSTGVIWRTEDFQSFREIVAPTRPRPWDDAKVWNGRLVLLDGDEIQQLSDDVLEDFPIPLPSTSALCLSLSPAAPGLAAIHSDAVQIFNGSNWQRLVPILEEA